MKEAQKKAHFSQKEESENEEGSQEELKEEAKDEKESPAKKIPKIVMAEVDKKIPDEENIREFASP